MPRKKDETGPAAVMKIERSSGVLMPITSLAGNFGIGTMGAEARAFADLLHLSRQRYWQILPLNPVCPHLGFSPYASPSTYAGNFLFLSLEDLQNEPWFDPEILKENPFDPRADFIEYEKVLNHRLPILQHLSLRFWQSASASEQAEFERFCRTSRQWLDDYALFMALAEHFQTFDWTQWKPDISRSPQRSRQHWQQKLPGEIRFQQFLQFLFFKQWAKLKAYSNERGINIIGDIPYYVSFESTDAWANPSIFQLDSQTSRPEAVGGVPPDYFSSTGQRWGNPLYRWFENNSRLNPQTLEWWLQRFSHMLTLVDTIRIDHFRGFESFWSIPASEETAVKGSWQKGPGNVFFEKLQQHLGELPLIAEDLGLLTPEVKKMRMTFGLPGMKILQFAFDRNPGNEYLPHNYQDPNCVVYTGTHDNNTSNGWFYGRETDEETKKYIMTYLGSSQRDEFHWQLIRLALSSIAVLTIFPAQDLLGYGEEFRLNTPGKPFDNWRWKLTADRLTPALMERLQALCRLYNRVPAEKRETASTHKSKDLKTSD